MGYVITITVSVVSAMLVFILQGVMRENYKLKTEKEKEKCKEATALENGVRQLLSVRLEELFDQYTESDSIPRRAYSRWMKLHDAYKGLHGNGTFDHMKEELEKKHITN